SLHASPSHATPSSLFFSFSLHHTATTDIYTLSLTRRSSDLFIPPLSARENPYQSDLASSGDAQAQTTKPYQYFENLKQQYFYIRSESTRLNSSHVKISYAVFCLKKKKKKKKMIIYKKNSNKT